MVNLFFHCNAWVKRRLNDCLGAGLVALLVVMPCNGHAQTYVQSYTWANLAGMPGGAGNVDGTGSAAKFNSPKGLAKDAAGNVYVADYLNHVIRKITPAGVVSVFAGKAGTSGSSDGAASVARFSTPYGLAMAANGQLYVTEEQNHRIRKVTPAGVVTTVAGSFAGSIDGTGTAARFRSPHGIVVDPSGNLFVADYGNDTIRKVTPAGVVTTVAGSPDELGSTDGQGSQARFKYPNELALDTDGNLYVTDSGNYTIRKVSADGLVTTLAGVAGERGETDGVESAARFSWPGGIVFDGADHLYVTESQTGDLRKVSLGGLVTTVQTGLDLDSAVSLLMSSDGNLLVSEGVRHVVSNVSLGTGDVTLLAGNASNKGSADGTGTDARFYYPTQIALDADGNAYITDQFNDVIRKVTMEGVVTTLAGSAGSSGSADGTGSEARFNNPSGIAVAGDGTVYVSDYSSYTVRKITPAGVVTTLAGSVGQQGSADGMGSEARFSFPGAMAIDKLGNIYVADIVNDTVRKITPEGLVTTLAGLAGHDGYADGLGSAARFTFIQGLTVDAQGRVYVADDGPNHAIRMILPNGMVSTVQSSLPYPADLTSIAVDESRNFYVTDWHQSVVWKITSRRAVIIGGTLGVATYAEGVGSAARFSAPAGVAVSPSGVLHVLDRYNNNISRGVPDAQPDIAVYEVPDVDLYDRTATVDFGVVAVDASSAPKTITLKNKGSLPLTGIQVIPDSNIFFGNIDLDTAAMSTELAPGESTSFSVGLTRNGPGSIYTRIQIVSNDPDEGIIDITLVSEQAIVSFAVDSTDVLEEAGEVELTLEREGGLSRAVSVLVSTANGSAKSPADYGRLSGHVVTFAPNEVIKKVFIPIVNDKVNELNETFTVTLAPPAVGAVVQQATTTVRIIDRDTKQPSIKLTSPAANGLVNIATIVTVRGEVADDKSVVRVEALVNSGNWTDADVFLTVGETGRTAQFIFDLHPQIGINIVCFRAFDMRGNVSKVASLTFFCEEVTLKGNLSINVLPVSNAGTITGWKPDSPTYEVGKTYTLTAVPAYGFLFDQWGGRASVIAGPTASKLSKLSFVYDGAPVVATFVEDPFMPAVIGTFSGLVKASGATTPSHATEGFLTATLTRSGSFSGTLKIDGLSLSFKGVSSRAGTAFFAPGNSTSVVLPRPGKPPLTLSLQFDLSPAGTHKLTGAVEVFQRSQVVARSEVEADRSAFDGKTLATSVPATYLENKGLYTLALPSKAQTNGLVASDYPQGSGLGSITVAKSGVVALTVTLADGTTATASGWLSQGLATAFYTPLYTKGSGSFGGKVVFNSALPDTDVAGTDFLWFRPLMSGQFYPWGWPEGVKLDLLGARYSAPASQSLLPGLASSSPNAVLTFSQGLLAGLLSKTVFIGTNNLGAMVPAAGSAWTITATPATGRIKGFFTHMDGTRPAYQGVVIKKGAAGAAYGYFLTTTPKPVNGLGQSGVMSLQVLPE